MRRLFSVLVVIAAICVGCVWGGIFSHDAVFWKGVVSWVLIWIAIDFYSYQKGQGIEKCLCQKK